jgi:hypothetical protein
MDPRAMRDAALGFLGTIASIPKSRFFWLLIAAIAGYSFGYRDAYRGPAALGWKFGDLVDRVAPSAIHEARRRNVEALRERTQQAIEIPQ